MPTLNHDWDRLVIESDGRYLMEPELHAFERYVETYAQRQETYEYLRDQGDRLVLAVLRKMMAAYPDLMQRHGARCQYDMTKVVQHMGVSVLRSDETLFRENILIWLDTILAAYRENVHCLSAYGWLKDVMSQTLPAEHFALLRPYFDAITQTLNAHA
jgi:hypothetical protein